MTAFDRYQGQLPGLLKRLKSEPPIRITDFTSFPSTGGCYVLVEKKKYLYVGIARNLKRRMKNHTCGRPEQSSLVLRLARKLAQKEATYRPGSSPRSLMKNRIFKSAMKKTTERVRKMTVKYVEIDDGAMRYLFEFFAAISLRSPYNDFNTN